MSDFLKGQYDYIYFFYGLSFLFLSIICFALGKERPARLPWSLLGLFGFLHGINTWIEVYIINSAQLRIFSIIRPGLLASAYLLLFEFARQGFSRIKGKILGLWVYLVILPLAFLGTRFGILGLVITLRYFLFLPAGLFCSWVIYKTSKTGVAGSKTLFVLSLLIASHTLILGLIAPKTNSTWQFVLATLALLLAVAVWHYSQIVPSIIKYQPYKYTLPFKPTKWIIMFSFVALIGLGWLFTNYFDYYAGIQIIRNTKANRNSGLNQLIRELTKFEQAAIAMSQSPKIKTALRSSNPEDIAQAIGVMEKYKTRLAALDCVLLNAQGKIVTSVDWSLPEGITEKSFAALAYFKEAMRGNTGYYFMQGSTYNQRLYYVGVAVKDNTGKIIGVLAVKKIISGNPLLRYRLLSIIITMFVCILAIIFFIVVRRREHLIEFIENAHARLEEVDKMKTDFISVVSHELRTPLTSIKNAATIMLKDLPHKRILGEDERELLEIVLANTNRQTRMINDLLDVSKIEAGALEVCLEPFDVVALTQEVASTFLPRAKEKGIEFKVSVDKGPLVITADPEHTRRILTNLIVNALNFTPDKGQVTLKVQAIGDEVLLTVSDTGIGIRDEDKVKLFNKFYRATDAYAHQRGGSGLGLVIAKGLVEAQGGRIWVDSVFGKGSSFYFTIPNDGLGQEQKGEGNEEKDTYN